MYTFKDRSDNMLTLRPENTASACLRLPQAWHSQYLCAYLLVLPVSGLMRAVLEHGLHHKPLPLGLWYFGPMFRYERPQRGRYRQFWQAGMEWLGSASVHADLEVGGTPCWPLACRSADTSLPAAAVHCIGV